MCVVEDSKDDLVVLVSVGEKIRHRINAVNRFCLLDHLTNGNVAKGEDYRRFTRSPAILDGEAVA